jgi:glycosyltransferase involved in cell wall biosynthesis
LLKTSSKARRSSSSASASGVDISESEVKVLDKPLIVACIPAYNEEDHIGGVILRTKKYVDQIIVCDDGSKDGTAEIAEALGAYVIRHPTNMGYGAGLLCLFSEALKIKADYIVTLDSDGQHDPSEIPLLLGEIRKSDVDIVIGSRFIDGAETEAPGWRNFGIKMINAFSHSSSIVTSDSQSGFRVYTGKALSALALTEDGMGISTEILLKAGQQGLKVSEVPIHVSYVGDTSQHNPIRHGIDVMLSSLKHISINHPLTFYGLPGIFIFFISLIFWIYAISEFTLREYVSINAVLLGLGTTMIGLTLVITAMIIWTISSLIKEQSNRN